MAAVLAQPGKEGAGSANGLLEIQPGYAMIRLPPASPGRFAQLSVAVQECRQRLAEAPVVFLCTAGRAVPVGAHAAPADRDGEGVDELIDRLGEVPQLLVGVVERAVTCAETCLFALCDDVLAASGATFALAEKRGLAGSATFVVPLPLLRLLGSRLEIAQASLLSLGAVDAGAALEMGLASEVLEADALQARAEALCARLLEDPAAVVAERRRLGRLRRCAGPVASGAVGGPPWGERPGCKRLAAFSAVEQLACKRARLGTDADGGNAVEQRCSTVAAALVGAAPPSSPLHGFMQVLLAQSLAVPTSERQPFQVQMVAQVGTALRELEAQLQCSVASLGAEIAAASSERAARAAAEALAASDAEVAREEVTELQAKVFESTAELRETLKVLKASRALQEEGDAEMNALLADKEKLQDALESMLLPIKAGTVTGAKAKKSATSLAAFAKILQLDGSVLEGLPSALSKKPAQRDDLENMVLRAFEAQLETRVAELETQLALAAPAHEARAEASRPAREAHSEARARQQQTSKDLEKAKATLAEIEARVGAQRRGADDFGPQLQQTSAQHALAKELLEDFRAGPLAAFEELAGPDVARLAYAGVGATAVNGSGAAAETESGACKMAPATVAGTPGRAETPGKQATNGDEASAAARGADADAARAPDAAAEPDEDTATTKPDEETVSTRVGDSAAAEDEEKAEETAGKEQASGEAEEEDI